MELDPPEPPLVALESNAVNVVGKDWCSRLDKTFTSSLGKYRKYKGNSVRDLLRAMRNKVSQAALSRSVSIGVKLTGFIETSLSRFRPSGETAPRLITIRLPHLLHIPIPAIVLTCLWDHQGLSTPA